MKIHRLILAALLIAAGLNAQTDFRPGWIVKNAGDTIQGLVDYRSDLTMATICRFKEAADKIPVEFSPKDLAAFRFTDSRFYVSRDIDGKKVFLEYLINGKASIYYMRDVQGDHYYLDMDGKDFLEIPYEEGIKQVLIDPEREELGNKKVTFKTRKHIGILKYQLQEAPELQSKINRMKTPRHKNLVELAEDYHNAVCEGEKCIIYQKELPFFKINLEAVAGVINFQLLSNFKGRRDFNVETVYNKFHFQSGVLAHIWMPRTNERLYFKTGFLYSSYDDDNGIRRSWYKVPIHLGYLAPKSYKFRPTASIGLISPSYSGGILFNVNHRINAGLQGWANFGIRYLPWIPYKILNYSILGTVYVEL